MVLAGFGVFFLGRHRVTPWSNRDPRIGGAFMINPLEMTGRTVLVTGASSGIGRECCILLSQLGAKVVLLARNEERLRETANKMDGEGHLSVAFDLTDADQIPELIKHICTQVGPLGGLVHCAGVQSTQPLRTLRSEQVEALMQVNVTAALMLAKGLRRKGTHTTPSSLVYIASVMGLVGEPVRALYSASKGAVIALTKSLAMELERESIRVNCIAPGVVRTEMVADLERTVSREQMDAIEAMHPLGIGEPRDIANAVAFLLAGTGRWCTGATFVVDGGYTAR